MSSSRPKSKLADGGLLNEAVSCSDALLCDIIDEESVMAGGAALFIRAAMPVGSMRRSRGDRSAKPDAEGRLEAIIATMAKVTELKRRRFIALLCFLVVDVIRCWLLILWEVNESERPAPAIEACLRRQARGIQSCVKARANVVEERR